MGFQKKLRESLSSIGGQMSRAYRNLQLEDIGWLPMSDVSDRQISLTDVKNHARRARTLAVLNPIVKRGLTVRNAYMWYDELRWNTNRTGQRVIEANARECFSIEARARDEVALNTDGCVIHLVDRAARCVVNVPLERLDGVATDDYTGEVLAVLVRPYKSTGSRDAKWVYIHGVASRPDIEGTDNPVDPKWTAVYTTVNRLSSERYGKPDLMGALYYANAYKEFLTSAHYLTKALARIAFKSTSVNAAQQKAVQQRMSSSGIGATASLGLGQDITAVSKAGAGIEFGAGTPLAAMVSAALDIPLSVLLTDGSAGGRQGAETALEDPTFKALELRRQVHLDMLNEIGDALGISMRAECGGINNDQVHRRVQSLVLGYQQGALHQSEMRSGVLQVLKIAGAEDVADLPEPPVEQVGSTEDGRSTGVGPMSDGTNDARGGKSTDA